VENTQCLPVALVSSYKIFRTAVNINVVNIIMVSLYYCLGYPAFKLHLFCALFYSHLHSVSTIFCFRIALKTARFSEKKSYWT